MATHTVKTPDAMPLTAIAAKRLAGLCKAPIETLVGKTIAELKTSLAWKLDPTLLLYRRVCGQVVRKDPATGVDYPVPHATVVVEDTDCTLLGYFPVEGPFHWFFPIQCARQELASVVTDDCGRFCAWIPRFEIEWIVRWRLNYVCSPIIFRRPSLGDLLKHLPPQREWPPKPWPDPGPEIDPRIIDARTAAVLLPYVNEAQGKSLQHWAAMPYPTNAAAVLSQPAQLKGFAPPVPAYVQELHQKRDAQALMSHIGVPTAGSADLTQFDPARFIGPFVRCTGCDSPSGSSSSMCRILRSA